MAILCGAILTLSYAPFSLWPLMYLGLLGLFLLLLKTESGFKTGFAFGLGWFAAGISWVHVSIADYGGIPLVGSIAMMAALCSYLALYPAFFAWLLKRHFTPSEWLIAAPVIWFVLENIRSWMLTGFPWLSLGYSQIDSPLSGWMPVIGETGLSALLVAMFVSVAYGIYQRRLLAPALLVTVMFVSGWALDRISWVTLSGDTVAVAMVQGNIKQDLRWKPEQERPTMVKYEKMTQQHWHNDIIIWPEAAIPKLEPLAEDYIRKLDEQAARTDTGLITGIVNYNFETRQAFNNLIALGKKQSTTLQSQYRYLHNNRYAKHHLLPIGEFIPFEQWLRNLAPIFDLPMSSFSRGEFQQRNLITNGYHLAPAICFEIAFPRQIAANLQKDTDFIITVSNDAWFGHSHGPAQHLEIAQVRAKEFGIPVLRATNNGITAFIDHRGNIISRLPQFEAAVLNADLHTTKGLTPYRKYGDLPLWLITISGLLYVFYRRLKK